MGGDEAKLHGAKRRDTVAEHNAPRGTVERFFVLARAHNHHREEEKRAHAAKLPSTHKLYKVDSNLRQSNKMCKCPGVQRHPKISICWYDKPFHAYHCFISGGIYCCCPNEETDKVSSPRPRPFVLFSFLFIAPPHRGPMRPAGSFDSFSVRLTNYSLLFFMNKELSIVLRSEF